MYVLERGNTRGKICTQDDGYCSDNVIRTTSWIGKVALMYPSDYGYSTSGGTTTNKETCLNTSLNNWDGSSGVTDCKNNSWIYKIGNIKWTLSPNAESNFSNMVFGVFKDSLDGLVGPNAASSAYDVLPSLFLKSSITIAEGNGSSESPYKLIIN